MEGGPGTPPLIGGSGGHFGQFYRFFDKKHQNHDKIGLSGVFWPKMIKIDLQTLQNRAKSPFFVILGQKFDFFGVKRVTKAPTKALNGGFVHKKHQNSTVLEPKKVTKSLKKP